MLRSVISAMAANMMLVQCGSPKCPSHKRARTEVRRQSWPRHLRNHVPVGTSKGRSQAAFSGSLPSVLILS